MVSDFGKSTYLPKNQTSFMDVPFYNMKFIDRHHAKCFNKRFSWVQHPVYQDGVVTFFELLQPLLLENLTKISLSFLGKKDFHIIRPHPLLFVNENELEASPINTHSAFIANFLLKVG